MAPSSWRPRDASSRSAAALAAAHDVTDPANQLAVVDEEAEAHRRQERRWWRHAPGGTHLSAHKLWTTCGARCMPLAFFCTSSLNLCHESGILESRKCSFKLLKRRCSSGTSLKVLGVRAAQSNHLCCTSSVKKLGKCWAQPLAFSSFVPHAPGASRPSTARSTLFLSNSGFLRAREAAGAVPEAVARMPAPRMASSSSSLLSGCGWVNMSASLAKPARYTSGTHSGTHSGTLRVHCEFSL